jgi:Asp-tRNA(Asn)/Glu-tRNA(Gln) amidotransferase A subunit family amidase
VTQASEALHRGRISPVELTQACLERIASIDSRLNSFIAVCAEQAMARARRCEADIQRGNWQGPLHGIPVAVKDLIDVEGEFTTAASKLFLHKRAPRDAEVVRRLRSAGAIIVGKTNLHEFAYGGSGVISHFGPARNPVNSDYITGGSSSGSAAAVAAGCCFASIGTDTAGSIRLPAAYCGIVGLKPTFGAVSIEGVVPLSWSYDHVGPMTRTVEDAQIVFTAISEIAQEDPSPQTFRVGVAREFFFDKVDQEISAAVNSAIEVLGGEAEIREIRIPVDEDRTVSSAEAFAYHEQFLAEHSEDYDPETLRRIRSGERITAATYIQKRRELEGIRRHASDLFRAVNVILTPTVPIAPSLIEELRAHPDQLRPRELLMLRNTRPFNVLGLPTLSVPYGKTSAGLPIGIQLTAAAGKEAVLFDTARVLEKSG